MSPESEAKRISFARAPGASRLARWWSNKGITGDFGRLYAASLSVDLGLCLYYFLFNLFLVEHRFTEQQIGFIASALSLGVLTGTVPASMLSKRFGLRPMLLIYAVAAPLCFIARTLFLAMPAQLALAFLAGLATSIWSVCFSPTLAKFTTQENRAFGFSVFVATGIGTGVLAGLIGGFLPGLLARRSAGGVQFDGIQIVLIFACVFIALAAIPILRIRFRSDQPADRGARVFSGFLLRFMAAIAVWNFSISFFAPFANVYMARHLNLPVTRIGTIYSISQVIQVGAVMLAPLLYRRVGLVAGIALSQIGTAVLLLSLSHASSTPAAIRIYLLLTALQWMSGPGLSSLLMNRTPEAQRSHAAAIYSIVNLVTQAGSVALAGKAFGQYGYSTPLAANALIAVAAATLLCSLLWNRTGPNVPASAG